MNRLYQTVMEAKHALSARSRASVRVEYAGRAVEVAVLREQFEEMTADLLERTAYTSRQLLSAAALEWKDVNRILLVGGSTRMPMVVHMLQKLTGIEPDRTVNPDEAVARGAALYAGHVLAAEAEGPAATFAVTNVNAHSLGIEGIEPETLRKTNIILIPRNTPLPATRTERFMTKSEGQQSIVVKVLEGESTLPGECTAIGRTVVRDLPVGLPKAWPVEITFEYATNGRLSVRAMVPGTHHQAELALEREVGLSGAGDRPLEGARLGCRGVRRLRGGRPRVAGRAGAGGGRGLVRHPGRSAAGGPHGPATDALGAPAAGRDAAAACFHPRRDRLALVGRRHADAARGPRHAGLLAAGSCGYGVAPNPVCPPPEGREAWAKFPRQPGRQGDGPYFRRRAGPGVRLFLAAVAAS